LFFKKKKTVLVKKSDVIIDTNALIESDSYKEVNKILESE